MNYIVLILQQDGTEHSYSTPYAVYPGDGPTSTVELHVQQGDTITFIPIGEKPVVTMSQFDLYTDTGQFASEPFEVAGFEDGARTLRILPGAAQGQYEVSVGPTTTPSAETKDTQKTTGTESATGTQAATGTHQTHPPIIVEVDPGG